MTTQTFTNIDPVINCLMSVIDTAKADSMPKSLMFTSKTKFRDFIIQVYAVTDAVYFYQDADRCHPVFNAALTRSTGNLTASKLQSRWAAQYAEWRAGVGPSVAANVIEHTLRLANLKKKSDDCHQEIQAFINSEHLEYWAVLANQSIQDIRSSATA